MGIPAFRAKDEGTTPVLESNRNALSLYADSSNVLRPQSVPIGKPDLPIHHAHVYFPVQLVHKLVERMETLRLQDVTPEEGKRYKHNSENEANSPYIIVGSYEGLCVSND